MNSTIFSGRWIFRWNKNDYAETRPLIQIHKRSQAARLSVLLLVFFLSASFLCSAQKADTLKKRDSIPAATVDSLIRVQHSPRKAAIRSAIIPGWGQAYNKKYWKIPIVYAALGITGGIFLDNLKTYKDLKFAYAAKYKASLPAYDSTNPYRGPYRDSTDYFKIKTRYQPISLEALKQGRNDFRRYIDYSVIFFVIFWGLNVVDAVVDAHLKAFDISPDLSMKIRPSYNPIANTGGISLVFNFRH
ncbi:MAG TPA: DUF5683 domain-containing protein [Chitinophagaceae bacterium]|nr:DUF5683 domain-containing protein [Chitinophagaceae bacterium]